MCQVTEMRMRRVFESCNERGVKMREWGRRDGGGGGTVKGEFVGARPGVVELVGEKGEVVEVRFQDLGEEDKEYVEKLAGAEEMAKLRRDAIE